MPNTHLFPGPLDGHGASKAVWKSQIKAAMNAWAAAFNTNWPKLTINFVAAPGTENDGDEKPNSIASSDTYNLPHDKGIGRLSFLANILVMKLVGDIAAFAAYPEGTTLGSVGNVGGDIHFNFNGGTFRQDGTTVAGEVPSILYLTVHELGHSFGLGHHRLEAALMYPSWDASDDFVTIPAIDLACLRTLYEADDAAALDAAGWHTDCNTDGNAGTRWASIATAIESDEVTTITITYSFYPPSSKITTDDTGATIHLLRNGGPANSTDCCICCDAERPYDTVDTDKFAWGTSCYSGCCPCVPMGSLSFEMHACKRVDPEDWKSQPNAFNLEGKDCANKMSFTMERRPFECYTTQSFANYTSDDEVLPFRAPPYIPALPTNMTYGEYFEQRFNDDNKWNTDPTRREKACDVDPPSPEGPNSLTAGTEYVDPDKLSRYPEAWGFSGHVCKEDNSTPDKPAFSYPGECGGQSIIASLCCCKTGDYSKGRNAEGGEDPDGYKSACPNEVWYTRRKR